MSDERVKSAGPGGSEAGRIAKPDQQSGGALQLVCVGLLVMCGLLLWAHNNLKVCVAFADEQTRVFDKMRTESLQSAPADAVGCLQYVVNYYPSGTKQEAGSRLDRMVERGRARAVHDIIAYLRAKTGEDLGERPEPWLKKFGK